MTISGKNSAQMARFSKVQLVIEGFGGEPKDVTALIGFGPTAVVESGWTSLKGQSAWLYEASGSNSDSLDDEIIALVQLLENHSEGIRRAAESFRTNIEIFIDDRDWISNYDTIGYRSGSIGIVSGLLKAISTLGVGLQIRFFGGLSLEKNR